MIRTVFCLLVLLGLSYGCTSKSFNESDSDVNDSIQKYLELAGNDSLDVKLRDNYNGKALALVDLERNDTLTRFYLSRVFKNFVITKNQNLFYSISKIYLEKSKDANDTLNLALYNRYSAAYFKNIRVLDSSFYYYLKAEKLYKKTSDILGLGIVYLNKGIVQFNADDYLGAEVSLLKAKLIFEELKNFEKQYGTYNQIGLVYNELREYKKSIYYHKKALETVLKHNIINSEHQDGVCYNNIGYLYLSIGKEELAIENFSLGLLNKKIIEDDPELYVLLKTNIASSYININKFNEAYKNLADAQKIKEKINGKIAMVNLYLTFSSYYQKMGHNDLALFYSKKGLDESKHIKSRASIISALSFMQSTDQNDFKKYNREYLDLINQSILEERKSNEKFNKIKLQTQEITQEKDKAISQKWLITGIASTVILIVVLILIITRQRARQKRLQLLQEQQQANEEIYQLMLNQKTKEEEARQAEKRRIARELHDGVMNKLSSARLSLDVLTKNTDLTIVQKSLAHIHEISKVEAEIRALSHDLSQEVFQKENSFSTMLEEFVALQNQTSKTAFELDISVSIEWNNVSGEIKMNLYRIIQEATHNIKKHAQAKQVTINFIVDDPNLCLSIIDDGVGFDTLAAAKGIGIQNMKVRVQSLNGKFFLNSVKGSTAINIAIPL